MPRWHVHKGSSLFKYVAYPVVLPASLPRLSVHGTGFIIHVSQIFPQMSRGVHRNPIHLQCKHILVCQLNCSRLTKLGIFICRSIYIYQQMQDFLDEYKSRSRGLQCFDITTRWLLECLECKYSCLLLLHLVVWWPIKARCIHKPAELRAPSNNVDPSVPLLLSVHFTICARSITAAIEIILCY